MERRADIVGWPHSRFGRLEGETVESPLTAVAREAIEGSGLAPAAIDEVVVGHYNAGLSALSFTSFLALQVDDALRFKRRPASRTPAQRARRRCSRACVLSPAARRGPFSSSEWRR